MGQTSHTSAPGLDFVHLHTHSEYSPQDGLGHLEDIVAAAVADGNPAIAITDHKNLGAAWKLDVLCRQYTCRMRAVPECLDEHGKQACTGACQQVSGPSIKPIIGLEAYLAFGSRFARDTGEVDPDDDDNEDAVPGKTKGKRPKAYMHLTLLAATPAGWANLVRLSHAAGEPGAYWHKPRIDFDLLAEHGEGIIVGTGCLGGPLAYYLNRAVLCEERAARLERLAQDGGSRAHFTVLAQQARSRIKDHATGTPEAEECEREAERLATAAREGGTPAQDRAQARNERADADDLREMARANLQRLIDCVGKENVFIEVMNHSIPAQLRVTEELRALAREFDIPLAATNDAHYVREDQAEAHEAWLAVSSKSLLSDPDRFKFHGTGHHLRTGAEMRALFDGAPWWQEACDNTVKIAQRIADRVLPEPRTRLPVFPAPPGFDTSLDYLRDQVRRGAIARFCPPGTDPDSDASALPEPVRARLNTEFKVIKKLKFWDYFLIVADVITWARSQGIGVGAGRGSGAGSLVNYCLGITNVEPLANGLLFERFLDVTRNEFPDIDTDFEQGRRAEVLAYFVRRWGREHVAMLGSFGYARTKAAIKDAARVLDLKPLGDSLSKKVPLESNKPVGLARLDDTTDLAGAEFRALVAKSGRDGAKILALARAFEDTVRQPGVHPCGAVLSSDPLNGTVPTRINRSKDAEPGAPAITEWDQDDVQEFGLVKMDFLGLRNLDVISKAVHNIAETTGETIDPAGLDPVHPQDPSRAKATWAMLCDGRTAGVFQLDSAGMTALTEQVAPESIGDLSALLALYRPGPMSAGMPEHYANRKNGREVASYDYLTTDPAEAGVLAPILDETFGTCIYQEQLMHLGAAVAGFDAAGKNALRRAVAKKKPAELARIKAKWLTGGAANTYPDGAPKVAFTADTLERLWVVFEGSGAYLFNKSHSVAYAQTSYQTAYLKANWPSQYGAALLACTDNDDKREQVLASLTAEGIPVLAPDVNRGQAATSSDGHAVRLGMAEIKDVGETHAEQIVAAREAGGPYTSVADLMARCPALSATTVEALAQAGALDDFGPRLGVTMIARASKGPDKAPRVLAVPDAEWGILERAARQRARLGCIVGEHPMNALADQLAGWTYPHSDPPTPVPGLHELAGLRDGQPVRFQAIVGTWEQRAYKGGQMVNMVLEAPGSWLRAVAFNRAVTAVRHAFSGGAPEVGDLVAVAGRVNVRQREIEEHDENGELVTRTEQSTELMVFEVHPVRVRDAARRPRGGPANVIEDIGDVLVEPAPAQDAHPTPDPGSQGPAPDLFEAAEHHTEATGSPPCPDPAPADLTPASGMLSDALTLVTSSMRTIRAGAPSLTDVQDSATPPVVNLADTVGSPVLMVPCGSLSLLSDGYSYNHDGTPSLHPVHTLLPTPPCGWAEDEGAWVVATGDPHTPTVVVLIAGQDDLVDALTNDSATTLLRRIPHLPPGPHTGWTRVPARTEVNAP